MGTVTGYSRQRLLPLTACCLSVCLSAFTQKSIEAKRHDVSDSQSSKVPLNDIVASAQAPWNTPLPPEDTEYPNTSSNRTYHTQPEPKPRASYLPQLKRLPKYFQCLTLDGFTCVTVWERASIHLCVSVCVFVCVLWCVCVYLSVCVLCAEWRLTA